MKKKLIIFTTSTIVLFLNFNYNIFHFAPQAWSENFARDVESLVIGNLAISEKEGMFYKGGLLGWNHPSPALSDTTLWENGMPPFNRFTGWGYDVPKYQDKFQFQTEAYLNKIQTTGYEIYYSNPGGQAVIYKIIGLLFRVKGQNLIKLSKILNALFSALTISLFLVWCYRLFGLIPTLIVLFGVLISQWITAYGNNIFYVLGSYFLPFSILLNYLESSRNKANRNYTKLFLMLCILLFIKNVLGGFEFITVTTLMSVMPIIFYSLFEKWSKKTIIKISFLVGYAIILSSLISLLILAIQISVDKGSIKDGFEYILWTLERRSYGFNFGYYGESYHLEKSIFDVIIDYWHCIIVNVDLNIFWLEINVSIIVSLLLVISIILLLINNRLKNNDRVIFVPILILVWVSIIAPVSWLIIFKNHSILHMHINPIIWHLPFLLFGYLFIGWGLKSIVEYLFENKTLNN